MVTAAISGEPSSLMPLIVRVSQWRSSSRSSLGGRAKARTRQWNKTKRILKKQVLPGWGKRVVHEIKENDVTGLIRLIAAKNGALATATLKAVRTFFKWLVTRNVIGVSPCVGLEIRGNRKEVGQWLSNDELLAIQRSLDVISLHYGPAPSITCSENRVRMTAKKSILTISRDAKLQNMRTLILEQAGYHVAAALNDSDALGFVEAPNTFSLVLLCHSVPEASRMFLVPKIKELKPNLPILMLYNGYDPTAAKVDGSLHGLDSPEAVLDMIGFLVAGGKRSAD